MKKSFSFKKIYIILTIIVLCGIISIATGFYIKHKIDLEKVYIDKQNKLYNSAKKYCNNLFEDDVIKDNVTNDEINGCIKKLNKVDDQEKTKDIISNCNMAIEYNNLNEEVDKYYNNNIVISSVSIDNINDLKGKNNLLNNEKYKSKISYRIDDIENNYNEIVNIIK